MTKIAGSIQDKEPSPSQKLLFEESQEDHDDRRKRRNILIMIVSCSFAMFGYGIYNAAYSQWIYVRFEMLALGENFSQLDETAASKDPCFRGNHTDSPFKRLLTVAQSNSAHFGVLTTLCSLIPSFFVNLLLGAYSDQLGRRLIFIVSLSGNAHLTSQASLCPCQIRLIFIVSLLGNTHLTSQASLFPCQVTLTSHLRLHCVPVRQRCSSGCGVCGGVLGAECQLGPDRVHSVWPHRGLCGNIDGHLCLYCRQHHQRQEQVVSYGGGPTVKGIFSFYFDKPTNPLYKRKDFIILGLVFMAYDASIGYSITIIFLMNEPFCWGSKHIGFVRSISGFAQAVCSTLNMRFLQMFLSDENVIAISLLTSVASRCVLAFAITNWQVYLAYGIRSFEPSVVAIIRAVLSRMVPKHKRGSLFASLAVIETATLAVSGAALNEFYSATVQYWRGFMYFIVACLVFISAVLTITYKIILTRRDAPHTTILTESDNEHTARATDFLIVEGDDDDSFDEMYVHINASFTESGDMSYIK
ncbi:proton-coupled folate transporter [Elysia marginata]|uniref:Proton-coupled folate transporter n=1 Tax=Elysia marginata TaxID=1093978 RepID=A0AAV4FAE3_9GAST|nr:proton-coupled folate transporter [Elysia marginata]